MGGALGSDAETLEALVDYAAAHDVDRSFVALEFARAFPHFHALQRAMFMKRVDDQRHYLIKVRRALRRRQMTVELGGIGADQAVPIFDLAPLPADIDMSMPDTKEERIDAILAAEAITSERQRELWELEKHRPLTPQEKTQLERRNIRNKYLENGHLTFAELVRQEVKNNFFAKAEKARMIFGPPEIVAGRDEADRCFKSTDRGYNLQYRKEVLDVLSLLPGFDPRCLVQPAMADALEQYRLHRRDLEDGEILGRQEIAFLAGRKTSAAKDAIQRAVSNFNSILKDCGLPTLKPKEQYRPKKKQKNGKSKQKRITLTWAFDAENSRREAVIAYANVLPLQDPKPFGETFVVENPVMSTTRVRDPKRDRVFNLEPHPLLSVVHVEAPHKTCLHGTFQSTLKHLVVTNGGNPDHLDITWELFHEKHLFRIQCSGAMFNQLVHMVLPSMKCNIIFTHEYTVPDYCLKPCVILSKATETTWTVRDCSQYE